MKTLLTILTTSRGWIVRQVLKFSAYVLGPFYAWLELQGAGEHVSTIAIGITALITALVEVGLSFVARKNR